MEINFNYDFEFISSKYIWVIDDDVMLLDNKFKKENIFI